MSKQQGMEEDNNDQPACITEIKTKPNFYPGRILNRLTNIFNTQNENKEHDKNISSLWLNVAHRSAALGAQREQTWSNIFFWSAQLKSAINDCKTEPSSSSIIPFFSFF
jgi:hypothetical protein